LKLESRNLFDLKKPNHDRENLLKIGLSESNATEYKAAIQISGPKLNAFINSTKAPRPNFQFLISALHEPL